MIPQRIRVTQLVKRGVAAALATGIVLFCVVTAGNAAASENEDRTGVSEHQILIGSCCALSGPARELGIQQLNGALAYIDYVNDNGGINGRKIKVNQYDDKYDPETAIMTFKQLVNDKCFAAAFFVGTPTGVKHVSMAETNQVPLIGMFTGGETLRDPLKPHVFHVRASYFEETAKQIDSLFKDAGKKRVGVIFSDDAFGAAVLAGYKKVLARCGESPVAIGAFQRNSTDVDDAINNVRRANPDFVGLVGQYTSIAAIVKRSHELGWHPAFGTVSFVGTNALIDSAGKDAAGVVISQVVPAFDRDKLPTVAQYRKLLHKYFPAEKPGFTSLEGFIDAIVLVDGIKRAGADLTRHGLMHALESMNDFDMGLGPEWKISFGADDHNGFDTVYLTEVKDGHAVELTDWKQILPTAAKVK